MSVHTDTAIRMAEEQECSYYFKNIIDLIRGTLRHNPYMLNHYCTYTLPQDVTITVDDDFTQIILTGSCEWEFTIIVAGKFIFPCEKCNKKKIYIYTKLRAIRAGIFSPDDVGRRVA